MGKLVDGEWVVESIVPAKNSGQYDRLPRTFLETIDKNHDIYKPESSRYHLYVSLACPWATRTLIYRELKNLENHIGVSIVHPDMLDDGWKFDDSFPGSTKDHLYNKEFLREIYQMADPNVTTSVTVPVLWDKKTKTIVNNESAQIIRIFNKEFNDLTGNKNDYYPKEKQEKINQINELIYENINNGVYKSGFASSQSAYDEAVNLLFNTLDKLEIVLGNSKYLVGESLTEADIRLIPTLLRFDAVYVTHFKCNLRRIFDYKNLHRYVNDLLLMPAISNTYKLDHIKRHYYFSHEHINPNRIIPLGPINL